MNTTLNETKPVARKRHLCSFCCREMSVGETYTRQVVVGDDGLRVWKECAHCVIVFARIWATDPDVKYYDDGIDLLAYLQDYGPAEIYEQFLRKWDGVDPDSLRELSWAPRPVVSVRAGGAE